ncbi:MAG: malate dehydrogenase [Candidatus Omnitrophica bacterium]|nr:malate dehydrogenase [Candidatus Omnitrophota bacterium]
MVKVTVVGAGNVGATCAQRIVEKDLADVVLLDVLEGMPQGKALDIMESAPVEGFSAKIIGTNDYADTKDSDVVVITAGLARKPGMSRDDLLAKNTAIVSEIAEKIARYSPKSILIVVTNPLDIMCYVAYKKSGFDARRVIGMAGVLDSARFRYFLSDALKCKASEVEALVLGGHGDTMVPLAEHITFQGKPVSNKLSSDVLDRLLDRTRKGGAEIVALLKTGSAYYAPASSAVAMVKSILSNEKKMYPCAALLSGEYGLRDIYFGVPVILGKNGIEKIVVVDLTSEEKKALQLSAESVKENIDKVRTLI